MNYNTWGTIILNEGNYLIVQSKDFLFKINSNNVNTSVEIFKNNNNIFFLKIINIILLNINHYL